MEEIVNDTVIEGTLKLRGWVVSSEAPLVLGVQLTHHISCVRRDEKGVEGRYQSLRLRRAGERYAVAMRHWQQTKLGEDKGFESDVTEEFSPDRDAVGVGYDHVLTVNLQTSTIRFWRKGESE